MTLPRNRWNELFCSPIHLDLTCPPDWVWVRAERGNDPYAALPPVFRGDSNEALSEYVQGLEEIGEGGAAMMAYAKMQCCELPDAEREAIRTALLRYCELDTLAMVMLFEYWHEVLTTS